MVTPNVLVVGESSAASGLAHLVDARPRLPWLTCRTTVVDTEDEALRWIAAAPGDAERVVVLDASRPQPDAYELCRRIRQAASVPLLVVGVSPGSADTVRALRLGADVCLHAPVDHVELLAYLQALVRRAGLLAGRTGGEPGRRYAAGELAIDFRTHEVRVQGRAVPLTPTEYRLLTTLAHHAGTTLPHALLLERVWGPDYLRDTRYLKVFVRRLRQKLGDDPARPRYLHTVWGVGYRFAPTEARVARPVAA